MTDRAYNHELKRFSTMSRKALKNRLYKITNMEKLEGFVDFAEMFGYDDLADLAREKIGFMEG